MAINTKHINYKLLVGSLTIVITILLGYGMYNYISYKNQNLFLEQEAKLVQNELSEIIQLYDHVLEENQNMKIQLDQSKKSIENILDSVRTARNNFPLIKAYQIRLSNLEKERDSIYKRIGILQNKIQDLVIKNNQLQDISNPGEILVNASRIWVSTLGMNNNHSVFKTNDVTKVHHIEVCLSIDGNTLLSGQSKNIYVQILDANNKIINKRGILANNNLEYSGKTTVNISNKPLNACLKISMISKVDLQAGEYTIKVYQDDNLLGNTTVTLN